MSAENRTPIALRYVIQACHDFEGEAAYTCLASFLGESQGERTLKEVLIRSLAVHIISLSAYGHLMSLQGVTSAYHLQKNWKPIFMLLIFFLMPEVAVVQLVRRTCCGVVRWFRNRQQPFYSWYYVSMSLGIYASESSVGDNLVALHTINPRNLRYERKSYSSMWLGRLVVLVILLIQDLGSLGIWYRSYWVYSDHWNTFTHFDLQNSRMALGGFAVVVNSILITLTNLKWHHGSAEEVQLSSNTHDELLRSHIPPTGSLENESRCSQTSIRKKLQIYNDIFETRLGYFFPVEQQREIEAAIILNTIAVLTKQLTPHFNQHIFCLSIFIKEKSTKDTTSLPPPIRENSNERWGLSLEGLSVIFNGFGFNILPSLASILILISFCNRYLAQNTWLGRYLPRRIRASIVFSDKWITGGRSVVAFPCFLVLAIYLIGYIPIIRLMMDAQVQVSLSSLHSMGTHWDQLLVRAYRYKDPWYDNMYVL
ncbi:hypothetical protein DM02DRAFT_156145 [Periconia macrospinosa]|uniref:Uncharacterized protein n=1 Tax=Periconia macrospinosa TaxID=97972 RepID=A0A2V1EDM6_9PLEO|nr:hypothetical protein DM02DRAFT_156145 [Periconia macrospinosa]